MSSMLPRADPTHEGSYQPPRPSICPPSPGEELARWLQLHTPPGAPVIYPAARFAVPLVDTGEQIMARHGIRQSGDLLVPPDHWGSPTVTPGERALARAPWLEAALSSALPRLPIEHVGFMLDVIAPEPTRTDLLPAFWRPNLRRQTANDTPWKLKGAGPALRAMAAAVLRDLQHVDLDRLEEQLELKPEGSARGTRRMVGRGRRLLHLLGAWPWSRFDVANGLPPQWWESPPALNALTEWHWSAWRAAWIEVRRTRVDGDFGRVTPAEHAEALAEWEAALPTATGPG